MVLGRVVVRPSLLFSSAIRSSLFAVIAAVSVTPMSAFAQTTPLAAQAATAATPDATTTAAASSADMPDIVVTGSVFRRANSETPSPVTVLTTEHLQNAGITTISDAVRSISADSSGSVPTSFTAGFGQGSSGVSLRGLSVNSTLVLIDGLRTANYPLADDGQRGFVDLNSIPQSIVDRVEVLKDGASSNYGADAIGGVVNIILKKQIVGVEATAEAGTSSRFDGGNRRIALSVGHGDLDRDGYNAYLNFEYQSDEAIYANQRGFPYNTNDLTSIGGFNNNPGANGPGATTSAVVRPATYGTPGNILSGVADPTQPYRVLNPAGCGTGTIAHVNAPSATTAGGAYCEQNTAGQYLTDQPSQRRLGATAHITARVGSDAEAYATATYYESKVDSTNTPQSVRSANPINTQTIALPALLSNGTLNPNNPYAATGQSALLYYTFGDIPGGSTTYSHVVRGSAGIHGTFGTGWTYSADATAAHSWLDLTQRGYLNIAALTDAINTGSYNFVNPGLNSNAIRAALSPNVGIRATSDLDQLQGVVTKELFQLPGGAVQLGVGGAFRYEAVNDPNANPDLTTINLNQYSAKGHHTVESAYFELNAPILTKLEVNVSGRYEHYSEGYNNFSPKVGAKFTPFRQLAIRGTYSKGFRAPSFAEGAQGSVIGFTTTAPPQSVIDEHGNNAYVQRYSIGFNTVSNPNIKPEKSESFTAGAVFQPTPWLSVTADYYNIRKTGVITGGPNANDAINAYYAGTPIPAGYKVIQDAPDPDLPGATRRVIEVDSPFVNAASLKTSGIDLAATANFKFNNGVRFTSQVEVTDIFKFDFSPGDGTTLHYVGTQAPYILSSGAGTPKWRGNWQNTVEAGPVTVSATVYYVDGYKSVAEDQNGAGATTCDDALYSPDFCTTKSFVDVDLVGSFKVNEQFTFYANVLNVGDRKPPLNPANYAGINYNPTWTQQGIVGRFYKIGARVKF
ncbi:TonB-dependent receptor [Polymorphobacter megasporae]|nr:TonB-dependent receptor [Polymorphobacter megasporae]